MANPIDPTLLTGKTPCGDAAPTWIVVVPQPPMGLEVDVFTSAEKRTRPGPCNAFSYIR